MTELFEGIIFIINNYSKYYSFSKEDKEYDELKKRFKYTEDLIVKKIIESCGISREYKVKFNKGNGNKPAVKMLIIRHFSISQKMSEGIYLVLFFKRDKGVYISLNQGTENKKIKFVEENANKYRKIIKLNYPELITKYGFIDKIDITDNLFDISKLVRPKSYEKGNIVAKYYSKEELLNNKKEFIDDISYVLDIYNRIILFEKDQGLQESAITINDEENRNKSINNEIENIIDNIETIIQKEYSAKILKSSVGNSNNNNEQKRNKKGKKNNIYELSYNDKKNIGWVGELYLFEKISNKDSKIVELFGIDSNEIYSIEWFNSKINIHDKEWEDQSIGHGCDIIINCISYNIYIEVKSSYGNSNIITITGNEIREANKNKDRYFIVKINNLLKDSIEINVIKNPYSYIFNDKICKILTDISIYM